MQDDAIKLLEADKLLKERKDREKDMNNHEQQHYNQQYLN